MARLLTPAMTGESG